MTDEPANKPWEIGLYKTISMHQQVFCAKAAASWQLNLPLDYDAETGLGDLIIAANERLFLLELKATEAECSSEWHKRARNGEGKDVSKAKDVLEGYRTSLTNAGQFALSGADFFSASVRCHQFAYWADEAFIPSLGVWAGDIFTFPYLLRAIWHGPLLSEFPDKAGDVGSSLSITIAMRSGEILVSEARLHRLFDGSAMVLAGNRGNFGGEPMSMGLPPAEFTAFMRNLLAVQGKGAVTIKGVVFSADGSLLRVVRSSEQFLDLLAAIDTATDPDASNAFSRTRPESARNIRAQLKEVDDLRASLTETRLPPTPRVSKKKI